PAPEPARGLRGDGRRRRRNRGRCAARAHQPEAARGARRRPGGRRLRLRAPHRALEPRRVVPAARACDRLLLGRGARAQPGPRQVDHHGLPRRLARDGSACVRARRDGDRNPHDRSLRARARHAQPLPAHPPGGALPVAEPRLRAARRRRRRLGAPLAAARVAPRARARARPPPRPPPPRPRPPRPRPRAEHAPPARDRDLRRHHPLPDGARRPPRGDLAAPHRLRARPDRGVQPRPRRDDDRPRPPRRRREARVRPRRPRRPRGPAPAGGERPCRARPRPRDDGPRASARDMSRGETSRLAGFFAVVLLLHGLGWGLFVWYSGSNPALAGLGVLAYTFGLRHAFDADHIAAIDNTTRKLLSANERPLGVGFFFSLGHSSIVFASATGLALGTHAVDARLPAFRHYGAFVGTSVSGTFLWVIGLLNLAVLVDVVRLFFDLRGGSYDEERLEQRLLDRGFMNRFF